jgi:4,5-dihydroxyphthalate decarboxylase
MPDLPLTFASGLYDRVLPLYTGEVSPAGVDLSFIINDRPREIFHAMTNEARFDASEMSCAEYVTRAAAGDCPLVAIPVFPSRVFRHSSVVVNRKAGIGNPKDLEGGRVGTPIYTSTAAVYVRGFLAHDYGVDLTRIHWVQGEMERPGTNPNPSALALLEPVDIEINQSGKPLRQLLEDGAIDATMGSVVPSSLGRHPDIARLFPDFPEVERDYYRRTGIFPAMHVVVIRRAVYEAHPFVAKSLFDAFTAARDLALARMRHEGTLRYMLPWMWKEVEVIREVFGDDPWPYGIAPNRTTLQAFIGYLTEQAMIAAPPKLEALFVPIE